MRSDMKRVIVTHVESPIHFYYKYLAECVNHDFSKFDFDLQSFGNNLYAYKSYPQGHVPIENELVIFFNVIENKWIRAKATSIGEDISLWCIDKGIFDKSSPELILPLSKNFNVNMNLVHLGALSRLPALRTFNDEIKPCTKWDDELSNHFKQIIKTAKTITFCEEMDMSNHKFGSMEIEDKNGNIFTANEKLEELIKDRYSRQLAEDVPMFIAKNSFDSGSFNSFSSSHSISISSKVASNDFVNFEEIVSPWGKSSSSLNGYEDQIGMISALTKESSSNATVYNESCLPRTSNIFSNENGNFILTTSPSKNDSDDEYFFKTCSIPKYFTEIRPPLPSTIELIKLIKNQSDKLSNTLSVGTEEDNISVSETIINLKANGDKHESSVSNLSPSSSITITTNSQNQSRKYRAMLAARGAKRNEAANNRRVTKPENNQSYFGIPAGYQLNALHTFNGLTKRTD